MKKDFLWHLLFAKNEHSLHSPFAYELYNSVIKSEKSALKNKEKINDLINRIIQKFNFQNNLFFDIGNHSINSNHLNSNKNPINETSLKDNLNYFNSDPKLCNDLFANLKGLVETIDNLDLACFSLKNLSNLSFDLFDECYNKRSYHSCFIFKDIYSSKRTKEFWAEVKMREEVKVTFDLYYVGLVFFKLELSKQNYRLRF